MNNIKGIEKASSLKYLMNHIGASSENLMACEDRLNDIPMLQYAGLSVAMGNAYDEVRKTANHVVSTNDEDGVAEAINKFLL